MHDEIWKDVQGFEGYYQVSSQGRVKSLGRGKCPTCNRHGKPGRILKARPGNKTGYKMISMSKPGMGAHKTVAMLIHRLVAIHFIPGRTEERWWVNHKDSNRSNNAVSNLEWVSPRENNLYTRQRGRWKRLNWKNPWPTRRANALRNEKLAA